eukprot:1159108-Pelagomonas_calceolata.AAC.3
MIREKLHPSYASLKMGGKKEQVIGTENHPCTFVYMSKAAFVAIWTSRFKALLGFISSDGGTVHKNKFSMRCATIGT